MASGKQLSFQHGEVSPTQQYRSNEAMYASALSKLRNFYVLNEGGIANRPGFISEGTHAFQEDIPVDGGQPGIVSFTFYNHFAQEVQTLEYYVDAGVPSFYLNGVDCLGITSFVLVEGIEPEKIRFTMLKDSILITPSLILDTDPVTGEFSVNLYFDMESEEVIGTFGNALTPAFTLSSSFTVNHSGAPYLPVTYLVTGVDDNGDEYVSNSIQSGAIANAATFPSTLCYPTATVSVSLAITVTVSAATDRIRFFNIYRAAGRGTGFFKLAGRVKNNGTASIAFDDYGADDPSIGPPEDNSLLGGGIDLFIPGLSGCKTASYYQQRLFMSYDPAIATNLLPGDIGASKLGAPEQIKMPIVFNNTGAFQFTVPVTDNTGIVAQLAMERLIVMTEKSCYVIRGGQEGGITPLQVNPLEVSSEGCSRTVEPKVKGRRGYYLNFDHTKLMAIEFGLDGNLVVYEISGLSEHLLEVDIHTMEVTGGREDTVYLCRRDGKLVRITMTSEAAGFSLIETDGYIENIFTKRVKREYVAHVPQSISSERLDPDYDALMAYIIRDGVRYTERLAYREDQLKPGFIYADAAKTWGERLTKTPNGIYRRLAGQILPAGAAAAVDGARINIQDGTTWLAGDPILLASTEVITNLGSPGNRMHVYYDDENGNEKFIQFISTGTGTPPGGAFDNAYEGYFTTDIPAQLRDVEALNPSDKLAKQTRWLLAYNTFACPAYLQTKELSVYMDGQLISSPNNPNMADTVITGAATTNLPEYFSWGVIGLPYTNDLETLDIEAQDNRTLSDAHKIINAVGVAYYNTQKGFFGMPNRSLDQLAERTEILENDVDMSDVPRTDQEIVTIPSEWTRPGRVRVVQVDALPMTIVALYPKGLAGE
jgi:hypothetical protein